MTMPEFTPVAEVQYDKRDPEEFMPWKRCTQTIHRPGKLIIVRPLRMIDDFRPRKEGDAPDKWRGQLCVADIACLDQIEPTTDELGKVWKGFPAGNQWREETIMLGYLNGAFKNYIGATCVGTVYTVKTQYPQPAIKWQDLAGDQTAVQRARQFLMAFPDFLIPRAAQITPVVAAPIQTAPVSAQPAQGGWTAGPPDPWATSQPVSAPPQPAPATHPNQGLSTLEQLKLEAAQRNAQGFSQTQDPPF